MQFLCSYSTLPLYAIVAQVCDLSPVTYIYIVCSTERTFHRSNSFLGHRLKMGSSYNAAIFEDHIQVKITGWRQKAKKNKGQRKAVAGGGGGGNQESRLPAIGQESTIDEGREERTI